MIKKANNINFNNKNRSSERFLLLLGLWILLLSLSRIPLGVDEVPRADLLWPVTP